MKAAGIGSNFEKVDATTDTRPSITCPLCGLTSYNFNDIAQRYCGHCHLFHDDTATPETA
jgi:transposase